MVADIWFWLFVCSATIGAMWSATRELHIHAMARETREIQRNQTEAVSVLHTVCERIDNMDAHTREQFKDLKELILDVERRARDQALIAAINRQQGQQINLHGSGGKTQIGDSNEQR
jgi:hypothetical protein